MTEVKYVTNIKHEGIIVYANEKSPIAFCKLSNFRAARPEFKATS